MLGSVILNLYLAIMVLLPASAYFLHLITFR